MEGNMVVRFEDMSFLSKQIFNIKVKGAVKECELIKETLRKDGILKRDDEKANLIIPSKSGNEIDKKYIFFKGYNSDGSIKPLRKFRTVSGEYVEDKDLMEIKVKVVDLYEKSVYLYESDIVNGYIVGNIIKEDRDKKAGRTVIFTKEKVKVLAKNVNNYIIYDCLDEFIDKVIL